MALELQGQLEYGPTGLTAPTDPTTALTALRQTRRITTATRWLIGDLAWSAIDHDPQRIPELLQETAEWDVDDRPAVMAAILVARRFPPDDRYESLSWSHHKEVARLDDTEAHRWLARAAEEGWSVHVMRLAIRDAKALQTGTQDEAIPKPWHVAHRKAVREIAEHFAGNPDGIVLLRPDGTWKPVEETT